MKTYLWKDFIKIYPHFTKFPLNLLKGFINHAGDIRHYQQNKFVSKRWSEKILWRIGVMNKIVNYNKKEFEDRQARLKWWWAYCESRGPKFLNFASAMLKPMFDRAEDGDPMAINYLRENGFLEKLAEHMNEPSIAKL